MPSRPRRARRARRWCVVALAAACACALVVARARVVDASASSNVERARARLREAREAAAARGDVEAAREGDDDDEEDDEEEPGFRSDDDGEDEDEGGFVGTYDACDTCEACALGDAPDGVALNAPTKKTKRKVHCKTCYGCNVLIGRMEQRATFRDDAVDVLHGASGAPVWKGKIMDGDFFGGGGDGENGEVLDVFVKAWCGVRGDYKRLIWTKDTVSETCSDRVTSHPTFTKGPFCSAERGMAKRTFCNGAFLGALDKISREAGLSDVIPRAKYMRAKTFAPWDEGKETSSGVKQDMDVMVFGAAPGVGFESLGPRITPTLLELLRKIDPDRILKLALFDLLTSQGDRHGQNIFITEDGLIHGIDNESSMRNQLNSMLIPGGQKFETYRVGFIHTVCSLRNNCDTARPSPSTLGAMLDYRCYVDGGSIGKKYPKQFEEFLRKVDAMEEEEVYEYFGMATPEFATKFKARVHDLLDLGFERTAKKLYAGMLPGDGRFGNFQYVIQPPCCGPSMCKLDIIGFSQEESQSCIHSCDVPIDPDFVGANTPNASNASAAANVGGIDPTPSAELTSSPPPSLSTASRDDAIAALKSKIDDLTKTLEKLRQVDDTIEKS